MKSRLLQSIRSLLAAWCTPSSQLSPWSHLSPNALLLSLNLARECVAPLVYFYYQFFLWPSHGNNMGFPSGSDGKASLCNAGDPGLIPGLGRSPGEGNVFFSILAWKIPWTQSLVGYRPWGRKESDTTEKLHFHFLSLSWVQRHPVNVQLEEMKMA